MNVEHSVPVSQAKSLLLQNCNVVDVVAGEVGWAQHIWISNGIIQSITDQPVNDLPIKDLKHTVIDGSGQFLYVLEMLCSMRCSLLIQTHVLMAGK